jgi:hypothetical protein
MQFLLRPIHLPEGKVNVHELEHPILVPSARLRKAFPVEGKERRRKREKPDCQESIAMVREWVRAN